jgi:predicted  nucleic acid-binding Zn-ribbon protein
MTQTAKTALKELQRLDREIREAELKAESFGPELEAVENAALQLETEAGATRARLQEMKLDERRHELSAEEKRARSKVLQERLGNVRNVREEAAVTAELDMVRRALESEEQDALTLLDQIRKLEMKLQEQEDKLAAARAEVEPRRQELIGARQAAEADVGELKRRRDEFARTLNPRQLQLYQGIRGRSGRQAVAELTADGACGHCFSVMPLQIQNEVRHGADLVRCEACGVILTAPDALPASPEGPEA